MKELLQSTGTDPEELFTELTQPRPIVVDIEGGPCAGKTTILNQVTSQAAQETRPITVVPEAATEFISDLTARGYDIADLAAHNRPAYLKFQTELLAAIIGRVERAQQQHKDTDAVVLADRFDIGAYVTPREYRQILGSLGLTAPPHLTGAEKVLYLPSLARENPAKYTALLQTNPARFETAKEAAQTCQRNLDAIGMHPNLSLHWGGDFAAKVAGASAELTHPDQPNPVALFSLDGIRKIYDLHPALRTYKAQQLSADEVTTWQGHTSDQEFSMESHLTEAGYTAHYLVHSAEDGTLRRRSIDTSHMLQLGQLATSAQNTTVHRFLIGEEADRVMVVTRFDVNTARSTIETAHPSHPAFTEFLNNIQESGVSTIEAVQ